MVLCFNACLLWQVSCVGGGFLHGAGVSRSKVVENRDGLLGSGDQMSQRGILYLKFNSKYLS